MKKLVAGLVIGCLMFSNACYASPVASLASMEDNSIDNMQMKSFLEADTVADQAKIWEQIKQNQRQQFVALLSAFSGMDVEKQLFPMWQTAVDEAVKRNIKVSPQELTNILNKLPNQLGRIEVAQATIKITMPNGETVTGGFVNDAEVSKFVRDLSSKMNDMSSKDGGESHIFQVREGVANEVEALAVRNDMAKERHSKANPITKETNEPAYNFLEKAIKNSLKTSEDMLSRAQASGAEQSEIEQIRADIANHQAALESLENGEIMDADPVVRGHHVFSIADASGHGTGKIKMVLPVTKLMQAVNRVMSNEDVEQFIDHELRAEAGIAGHAANLDSEAMQAKKFGKDAVETLGPKIRAALVNPLLPQESGQETQEVKISQSDIAEPAQVGVSAVNAIIKEAGAEGLTPEKQREMAVNFLSNLQTGMRQEMTTNATAVFNVLTGEEVSEAAVQEMTAYINSLNDQGITVGIDAKVAFDENGNLTKFFAPILALIVEAYNNLGDEAKISQVFQIINVGTQDFAARINNAFKIQGIDRIFGATTSNVNDMVMGRDASKFSVLYRLGDDRIACVAGVYYHGISEDDFKAVQEGTKIIDPRSVLTALVAKESEHKLSPAARQYLPQGFRDYENIYQVGKEMAGTIEQQKVRKDMIDTYIASFFKA